MNVTAVLPSQAGFFTVWPCGTPMPETSNLNFTPGAVVANGVVASLGVGGAVCIYSNQQSDVLVDVLGWFSGGAGQPPYTGGVPSAARRHPQRHRRTHRSDHPGDTEGGAGSRARR